MVMSGQQLGRCRGDQLNQVGKEPAEGALRAGWQVQVRKTTVQHGSSLGPERA